MKIPFAKPQLGNNEVYSVIKTLKSGILVHGTQTKKFEEKLFNFINSKNIHVSTAASCTAAMHLFYFTQKISHDDEIIMPAQSHVATAHALELCGGKPIFIDSNNYDGNIDVKKIECKLTKKTKGICVTHFLGKPVNMDAVLRIAKKYNLFIIEDCALALGSKFKKKHVGIFGDFGAFSFHPVKLITTAEGGAFICKNKKKFDFIKSAKSFGYDESDPIKRKIPGNYNIINLGFNYRMNEIEASIGIEQLKKIKTFIKIRKKNFNLLKKKLISLKGIQILDTGSNSNYESSYYALTIILNQKSKRNKVLLNLKKKGIGGSVYYPHPIPLLKYYKKKYNFNKKDYPNASKISYNGITLPIGPHINEKKINYIYKILRGLI